MLTKESDAWDDYEHGTGSRSIIVRDTRTGMYGYASLVIDYKTGEENIIDFEPDIDLTDGIKTGEFDLSTHSWVD